MGKPIFLEQTHIVHKYYMLVKSTVTHKVVAEVVEGAAAARQIVRSSRL